MFRKQDLHRIDGPVVNRVGVVLEAARPTPTMDMTQFRAQVRTEVAQMIGLTTFDLALVLGETSVEIRVQHAPIFVRKRARGKRGGQQQHQRTHPSAVVRAAAA